jgi:hypothetical protein
LFASFPLFPIENGRCTCNREECSDIGKHPCYPFSELEEGEQVPARNGGGLGIATGVRSGIFVVDVDGDDALRHLRTLGEIPRTYIVRTGREEAGLHLYFKMPDFDVRNDTGRRLGHNRIDIRGNGGFVVAAGSPHKSGKTYTVALDAPIADAPTWMLDMLRATPEERRAACAGAPTPVDLDTPKGEYRVGLAAKYCEEEAEPAVQGMNGSGALWHVAQKLVRTYELPLEAAAEIIEECYNDRCSPAWSRQEIWHKLEDARDRGTWMCGCPSEHWVENLVASAHKPVRVVAPVPSPAGVGGPVRMRPNPGHVYTFTPGDRPNGKKDKITFAVAIADLVGHRAWDGVLQYDEFRRRVVAVNPPMRMDAEKDNGGLSDEDGSAIAAWFEVDNMSLIGGDMAYKAALQASRRNAFHPVREYLDSCVNTVPVKNGILGTLATRALGATDVNANEFLKKTLVAAVRRVRHPGCQMDTVLVLYGGQGFKKSTFVRELFGPQFVRSQMPELSTKDASQALNGFWAIELAELARIVTSENSTVKEFLTRPFDDYRPPYGRVDMRFPRQCVLIGTTNDEDFLSDATGNRRYLPIGVNGKIDIDYVIAHRDEIWAEACLLESAGYPHWFEDETLIDASREQFVRKDAWQEHVGEYLKGRTEVTNQEIFKFVVMNGEEDLLKYDRKVQMRIADTLKRLGCVGKKSAGGERVWTVPDKIRLAPLSAAELRKRTAYNALDKLTKS